MTVNGKRRATSTLSPVPDMLQSPVSTTTTAKYTTAAGNLAQVMKKTRTDINRHLQNDKAAIISARAAAMNNPNWSTMKPKHQEQVMKDAALAKIQQRKSIGNHISSYFPVFGQYVPPLAYGGDPRDDSERLVLINKALGSLDVASARRLEEGDDEELGPRIKKQEKDDVRDLNDILPYTKVRKAATTKRGKPGNLGARGEDDSDTGDSSAADSNDEDEEVSDAESEVSELESEEDEDEVGDDEDEDERVTFVAVSRGRPITSDMPLPAKAYVNRKQHFATGIKCIEQAVVRGQVPRDDENRQSLGDAAESKDSIPKKRSCEGVESGGCGLRKSKRVKTETDV